ncbi:MAG: HigA family addiction module antidote protein [Gemmatimonadetes bacterium]|nr:HigA family addiction module antidote protein [Gemmatimonadota bacterium]
MDSRHPGQILLEDFLAPRGMTQTALAERLHVPYQRVNQIINRRRSLTPDTALRLARLFGTTPRFWLERQLEWDLHQASTGVAQIERIHPVGEDNLREITERIVEAVDPEAIIVFGSAASGEASPDSDIDLLVVDRHGFGPDRSRRRQIRHIRAALAGIRVPKDILVYGKEEFERWRGSPNHIVARAVEQGRILYERS